jgi:hypothetical protein
MIDRVSDNGLSAKDERIADLYSAGFQPAQIACELSCSVQTVYRKLKFPGIKARIADVRTARLQPVLVDAEVQVRENLRFYARVRDTDDGTVSMRDRIAAANSIDRQFAAVIEPANVRAELADLHAQAVELTGDPSTDD